VTYKLFVGEILGSWLCVLAAGCGDDDGSGGSSTSSSSTTSSSTTTISSSSTTTSTTATGAGGGSSVIGTTHDGECSTADEFAAQCEGEGGVLGDNCQDAGCGGAGYSATCYPPPPAPTAAQFSCDGLFNCDLGEVCHFTNPIADGCFDHACEPPPGACAADVSCACLEANWPSPDSVLDCTEDASGNPTIETAPF
jgi:hypothetical protein